MAQIRCNIPQPEKYFLHPTLCCGTYFAASGWQRSRPPESKWSSGGGRFFV